VASSAAWNAVSVLEPSGGDLAEKPAPSLSFFNPMGKPRTVDQNKLILKVLTSRDVKTLFLHCVVAGVAAAIHLASKI